MAETDSNSQPSASGGQYVVVARRYRPQSFDTLVGQEHVAKALKAAISSDRVGHAYLFTGARGVGKTSAARILSKALCCVNGPTETPCGECDICQSVAAGGDVDVLEIDGASNRGIEEIRQLRSNVGIRPSRARYKIYIIDEVHMLTREAFNALLKTLEEPPEHVKFIFCTTEATKIPVTVLSRCQRFDFAGIQPTSIAQRLAEIVANEGLHAEPEALAILARRAAGSMRDSQSLLEQLLSFGGQEIRVTDVHALLGTADTQRLLKLAEMVAGGDAAGALAELDTAVTEGVDVGEMLEQLLGLLRDAMTALAGCGGEVMLFATSTAEQQAVAKIGESLGLERILAMLQIVEETLSRLRYSTHRRTLAEVALVRLCRLEDLETIATLAAQLAQGGTPPAGGAPRPAPRVAGAASAAPAADLAAKKKPPAEPLTAPVAVSQSAVSSQPVSESAPSVPEQSPARVPGASLGPAAVGEARVPGASEAPPQTVPANTSASPIEVETPPVAAVAVRPAPIPAPHVSVPSSRQEVEPESFAYDEPSDASTLDEPTSYDAPRSSSSKAPFPSDEAAEKAWNACLEKLSGMVAARGKNYQKVAMKGPRLEVTFSETYNFCKSFFEQHERRRVVEQTLSEIAGTEVHVNFMITQAGAAPAAAAEAPRQVSPAQRMKVIHEHVMVRRASELFGSKIDIVE